MALKLNSESPHLVYNRGYIELGIPSVALRFMSVIMGVLIIPIAYLTIKSAGIIDIWLKNGFVTQGRLILHDRLSYGVSLDDVNRSRTWSHNKTQIAKNLFANTLCLIVIPVILYIIVFFIHIAILKYCGADELYFPLIKGLFNLDHQVCLLMLGNDEDNFWTIRTVKFAESPENTKETQELQEPQELQESHDCIYDGALIHLEHFKTERSLHSNVTEAPVSDGEFQKEVR
ncbi:hypothetical protein C2G38_2049668 [Gigaspora rosea]|uniref:Uncharacterized protein n=1 Tax=Gigaspora rosea TaxID=44941 RepID=A0A397U6I3_9GLOM|nr:hypothetical protein C2G38_2049668 [Gigaspora rosea]